MNLDYLKTFIEVIKQKSFSDVAEKLEISQPAVSFQIQKLERDLGTLLIDRSKKTVTMTEAGKRLLRFAENVESEHNLLLHDIALLKDELSGELIIAASNIPAEYLLPPILGKFKSLHLAVNTQMIVSDSAMVINGIRNGDYEVGFCGMAAEGYNTESFKVGQDEIVLIVFPEHPFAKRKSISFSELEEESFIAREQTSGTHQSLISLLTRAGFDTSKLKPSLTVGSTQAVISAVEARAGIAFVSNLAINKSLNLGLVHRLTIEGLNLSRDFYCIYQKKKLISRIVDEFISFVRVEFNK